MEGNYIFEIGSRGQGAGEEIHLNSIIEADQSFYSMTDKMIVYDSDGKFTGRERNVLELHPLDMGRADTSGIVTCTLDSLYFGIKTLTSNRLYELFLIGLRNQLCSVLTGYFDSSLKIEILSYFTIISMTLFIEY